MAAEGVNFFGIETFFHLPHSLTQKKKLDGNTSSLLATV